LKTKRRYLLTDKDNIEDIKLLNLKYTKIIRNSFSKTIILKVNLDKLNEIKQQLTSHNIKIIQISGTLKSIKNKKN
jgi:hypothetical protein|tara:strand:+ start:500 stop:727 length:228 start_codon:yes stop_codon:yes gene_type:complete